jgi:hypothetical protein
MPSDAVDRFLSDKECYGNGGRLMKKVRDEFKDDGSGRVATATRGMLKDDRLYDHTTSNAGPKSHVIPRVPHAMDTTDCGFRQATNTASPGTNNQVASAVAPERMVSTASTSSAHVQTPAVVVESNQRGAGNIVGATRPSDGTSLSSRRRQRARAAERERIITAREVAMVEREKDLAVQAEAYNVTQQYQRRSNVQMPEWISQHQWNHMSEAERYEAWDQYNFQAAMYDSRRAGREGDEPQWGRSNRY